MSEKLNELIKSCEDASGTLDKGQYYDSLDVEEFYPHAVSILSNAWECKDELEWRIDFIVGACIQMLKKCEGVWGIVPSDMRPFVTFVHASATNAKNELEHQND